MQSYAIFEVSECIQLMNNESITYMENLSGIQNFSLDLTLLSSA